MKPKRILLIVSITSVLTTAIILTLEFFIMGFNKKSQIVLSVDSPDRIYKAYVEEGPSIDPPNQSLFLEKNGTNEFKLVDDLPEDIDRVQEIIWSPDSRIVVFATDWYLIITNVEKFNTRKVSLNADWWKWQNEKGGAFSSSNQTIEIEKVIFIDSESLEFKTNIMSRPEIIPVDDV